MDEVIGRHSVLDAVPEVDVARVSGGYVLRVDAEAVDLHLFRVLVARARDAGDGPQALGVRHEALRNWIGQDEADGGERDDRPTATESEELRRLRKENAELKRANEILKAASAFSRRNSTWLGVGRELVDQLRGRFGVEFGLRVPGIASSTYHGWMAPQVDPSRREREDEAVTAEITDIHAASGGTYGSPRVHQVLRRRGIRVSRTRVERADAPGRSEGACHRRPTPGALQQGGPLLAEDQRRPGRAAPDARLQPRAEPRRAANHRPQTQRRPPRPRNPTLPTPPPTPTAHRLRPLPGIARPLRHHVGNRTP